MSPDGQKVAYLAGWVPPECACDGPWMFAVPSSGGTQHLIAQPQEVNTAGLYGIVVGPAGQWLATTDADAGGIQRVVVTTWDGSGFDQTGAGVYGGYSIYGVLFCNDDSRLIVTTSDPSIYLYNTETGSTYSVGVGDVASVKITPVPVSGQYRLVISTSYSFEVLSKSADGEPTTTLYEGNQYSHVAISPDGNQVVFRTEGNLYRTPVLGGLVHALDESGNVVDHTITPDGQRVVYRRSGGSAPSGLYMVDLAGGTPLRISTSLPSWGDVTDYATSSDSQTVVYRADVEEDDAFQLFAVPITGGESLEIGSDIEAAAPRTVRSDFTIAPGDGEVVYRTGFVATADPPAEVLFSVALDTDGDGDDVLDSADCDSANASVWAVPGEVTGLTLSDQPGAPDVSVLTWTAPQLPGDSTALYDVLRTESPSGFADGTGITCLQSAATSPTTQDPEVPGGVFFYLYLARAVNGCGDGTAGPGRAGADAHDCD